MSALPLGGNASIPHRYLTRHVGIFGATGTGKTTTLGAIAERAPCPVLILDAKGDLGSLGTALIRPTMRVDSLGAELMSRALDLSDAQSGALHIACAWAADNGIGMATLQDLRAVLNAILQHDMSDYGLVTPMSVAAIQRALLRLERGAPWAFGDSTHDPRDTSGIVVYAACEMTHLPGLYGAFVAYVLDSLYRGLGELGDVAAPGLMVLVDESHLLFDGATSFIVSRIEQITRLIRSKGVGLIYVSQSPRDLPDAIAGQLATRVQHALRAATPMQQKELRAAAETMPGNVTAADILSLETGAAFVSTPDASGAPLPARKVQISRGAMRLHAVEMPAPPIAARPLASANRAPRAPAKRRKWYFWPLTISAVLYGAVILSNVLQA